MRTTLLSLAFGLGMATLSAAAPAEDFFTRIAARATSPDETCGSSQPGNYSCGATNEGPCCSASGYCGSTAAYCGDGCQTGFGTCSGSTTTCGQNGGASCATGYCCSGSGYCGTTADYCGATCQSAFGQCGIQSSPTTTAPGSTPTDAPGEELCGANNGQICSNNQCCSQAGYCGTTSDYCADPGSCDLRYGRCDSTTTPAGPSTANAPRPALGSVTYDDDIYECDKNGVVALTYDDGPYVYTEQLLNLLKSYGFTATFFITGNNNGKGAIDTTDPYPKLIQRMIAEGHQVASHTWSHYSLSNITQALRISQMVKNEMAFNNIIGKWPTYMRPPYSQCSDSSGCTSDMKSLGYHRVYFDLDTQDYLNPSPNQIQNSKNIVKNYLANKNAQDYLSIQHDIVQQSVTNLSSYYFDQIKNRGWKGVTVGECMNDDPKNWYRSLSGSSTSTSSSTTTSSRSTSVVVPTTTSTSSTKPITTPTSTTSTSAKPTTSSTSTTSSSTRTRSTTSSAPAPTSTCSLTIGKFCGKIDPFNNAVTCRAASNDCNRDYFDCLNKNGGIFSPAAYSLCAKWQDLCSKLTNFCRTCANSCNNRTFGY